MTLRTIRAPLALALTLTGAACSAIRFGGDERDLSGSYTGSVQVEGEAIPGTLNLIHRGDDLEATFSSPEVGISAQGKGSVDDEGGFTLVMDYNMECPGVARFEGTVDETGRLSGSLEATDCTGTVMGSFSFRPREGG